MRYRGAITVPAGTLASAPEKQAVKLCQGFITEVEVYFPAGQMGRVFLQVYYEEKLIFPTSPGQSFRGDDSHITIGERFVVDRNPFAVELRAWSPEATLEHTVYVDFTVLLASGFVEEEGVYAGLPEGI